MEKLLESARGKPESNLEAGFQNSLSDKLVGMDRTGFLALRIILDPTEHAARSPYPPPHKEKEQTTFGGVVKITTGLAHHLGSLPKHLPPAYIIHLHPSGFPLTHRLRAGPPVNLLPEEKRVKQVIITSFRLLA